MVHCAKHVAWKRNDLWQPGHNKQLENKMRQYRLRGAHCFGAVGRTWGEQLPEPLFENDLPVPGFHVSPSDPHVAVNALSVRPPRRNTARGP